ncbi:hypothetical protein [Desmospora profundinema]|uniref:Uncharacterized protein n=1 Tax=Desmospora profundinema TaxID=1571184 RepID=A0ABU1IQB7_9BACL|nr:hypothetical protein [Desmospora profundinema]MDR6226732.1 hypothetical protein [Desmospora profundinema]
MERNWGGVEKWSHRPRALGQCRYERGILRLRRFVGNPIAAGWVRFIQ